MNKIEMLNALNKTIDTMIEGQKEIIDYIKKSTLEDLSPETVRKYYETIGKIDGLVVVKNHLMNVKNYIEKREEQ